MYFRKIEKGFYDLKGDGNPKIVVDLMTRVKVREKVIHEMSLYDKYDVPSGERPEDTAFKHFGDSEYHWIILLTNNITDRYYGWPLSEQDFESFVKDKYANPDAIHHYELAQTSGPTSSSDESHMLEVNSDTDNATAITNREYEEREQNKLRQIRVLDRRYLNQFVEEFERLIKE